MAKSRMMREKVFITSIHLCIFTTISCACCKLNECVKSCLYPSFLQELAEQEGDMEKVTTIAQQLEEIEERADQLDKQRMKGLSAIRYSITY